MKDYELYSNMKIPKDMNIIIRLDGRKFHNLSKKIKLEKPYDFKFSKLMGNVSKDLFKEFSPKFIYSFSDEINILLSEVPFSGRLEKLDSVFASFTSSSFTYQLNNFFNTKSIVSFDSRVIPVNNENVFKYFKWRQDEAWKNCVNSYGIWILNKKFSKKEANERFNGLKMKNIHELLFNEGINLNNLPTWQKRGFGVYKKIKEVNGFNPLENKKTVSYKKYLNIDFNLNLFDEDFFKNF